MKRIIVVLVAIFALGVVAEPVAAHPRRSTIVRKAKKPKAIRRAVPKQVVQTPPPAAEPVQPQQEPEQVFTPWPDSWATLTPEAKCAEAVRDWLRVEPWIPVHCDDEPLMLDGKRKGGLCYCLQENPYVLIDVTGWNYPQDLAWLIGHELAHRWYAEREPERFYHEPLMDEKGYEWTRRCLRCP